MKGVKTPKNSEVKYRRQLDTLVTSLAQSSKELIIPLLYQLAPQYTNDSYAVTLERAFDALRTRYVGVNKNARIVAQSFVDGTNTANKQRFYKAVETAIGVDLENVLQNENLSDILIAKTNENVALIRSIPEEYFKKIETIVFEGVTQGSKPTNMIKEIMTLNQSTHKRAKLIARDQTSKLNSALTQQRQQNLGVEEYVWRTAEDGRVRDSHASKNGQVFRWDDPPKDTGHPGEDIQCRCIAEPIIKI